MTIVEFLRLLVRRWYIVLFGLALTGLGAVHFSQEKTLYSATTTVNVLVPDVKKERIMGYGSADAINVANVLAARVNGGVPKPVSANPDVKLSAAGIERGVHATVRNEGGQWRSQVSEPIVQVQVVDPDKAQVLLRMNEEVARIGTELKKLEDGMGVPATSRIQLEVNPAVPNIDQETTYPSRAMAGYGLFGLGATLVAAYWFDRLIGTLRTRRTRRSGQTDPTSA